MIRARYWLIGLLAVLLLWWYNPAWADGPQQQDENEACLSCHSSPELSTSLPNGDLLPLYIDREVFGNSVHGELGLKCTDCHTDITGYPHPPLAAGDRREFQIDSYTQCKQCHQESYDETLDSIHGRLLAGGNRDAAICTDCHGAHDVTPIDRHSTEIPLTCSKCHSAIYNEYRESVHGEALAEEANRDVPTCVDCHGVHIIEDPRTTRFRLHSPELCAECHADEALMTKYGISTSVFDTYVADFHGTTVTLFERQSPDQPTNKPVCYDCHGVHDIKKVDDPESAVIRENLLRTCQKCHPDAQANFPASWTSHYEPSPTKYPLVYYVNLFYRIFIPTIIGGMAIFVALDAGRRISDRFRRKEGEEE